MSVSGFFSSIADKAQSAINQTPLAGHVPGTTSANDSPANHAPGYRSLALESLQHQIRNLGQQYTSTSPVQRIITLEKGVALDLDALARDGKTQSKELYTWGQHQDPDLTDVTDRLAFLNFVHASLSGSLAVKLDNARATLKALRDAEVAITPKRNIRAGLRNQIARLEHSQEKGGERRIAELREQLARAERSDEQLEKEIELLKRKAVRDGEQRKWDAIREYGEKLVLLSQAADPILGALPTLPPTDANPYTGTEVTATARASLQHALDNYMPGQSNLGLRVGANLSRSESDTRSFGESHASELSSLASPLAAQASHPGLSLTPPIPEPVQTEKDDRIDSSVQSTSEPAPVGGPLQDAPSGDVEPPLEDLYTAAPPKTETAEEEKRRLEREERERVVATRSDLDNDPTGTRSESAEEEKKRLEREEQERVLAGGADAPRDTAERDGDELPPYKDFQE